MLLNKQMYGQKKVPSKNLHHRRVITEVQPMPTTNLLNKDGKKAQRVVSKPRFIDVYSKYVNKNAQEHKKTYGPGNKIAQHKVIHHEKHLKTQTQPLTAQHKPTTTSASLSKRESHKVKVPSSKYEIEGVAGKGTFGIVYYGVNRLTGERIAIKKVFQDKKYKNREHIILKMLDHPNNLSMKDSFLTNEGQDQYLNIVMDYFPDNLYQLVKKKEVSSLLTKIYIYQIFRGLNYLNMLSIAHRDIKPQNILVDKNKHLVVITDFGSAKQLVKTQANLAYICSRCYRAPQLIFGATDYTPQIDMWSTGCVLVEMINGTPPFMGDSQVDQLIQIIKVLGTPSKTQVEEMNKNYDMREYAKFPKVKTNQWKNLLKTKDPLLIHLVTSVLQYSPKRRLTPAAALYHEYFDDLREEARYQELMFKAKTIPDLFDFSQEQMKYIAEQTDRKFELVPEWTRKHPLPKQMLPKQPMAVHYSRKPVSTKAL